MTAAAAEVRCPDCGQRQPGDREKCSACGAAFQRLCECDAFVRVFDPRCEACGVALLFPSYRPVRRLRRWVGLALLTLVVAVPATLAVLRAQEEKELAPWQLKNRGLDHFRSGEFAPARRDFETLTLRSPGDVEGWYMLALTDRTLGFDRDVYLASARQALALDPARRETLEFLAVDSLDAGEVDQAREYALRAAALREPSAKALRLLGLLEFRMPRPDLRRAVDWFERARDRDPAHADVDLLTSIATLRLRLLGQVPADLRPPEVVRALREAREAIEREGGDAAETFPAVALRAEVLLSEGSPREALRILTARLEEVPPETAAREVARIRVLSGRALQRVAIAERDERLDEQAAGRDATAAESFARALADDPSAEIAGAVAQCYLGLGRAAQAVEVLTAAAAADPAGAVRSVLAGVLLDRGDADGAAEVLGELDGIEPPPAGLPLLRADVAAARGDLDEAARDYRLAAQDVPSSPVPHIRIALLSLRRPGTLEDRMNAVAAAVADLEALLTDGGPAQVRIGLARLESGRGGHEKAQEHVEAAVEREPWEASHWIAAAEIWSRSTSRGAFTRTAACAQRAAALQPDDGGVVCRAASLLLRNGQVHECATLMNLFLERHPDHLDALTLRADARRSLGRWGGAAADLERIVAAGRVDTSIRAALMDAHFRAGRSSSAMAILAAAREAGDGDVASLDLVAALHGYGTPQARARLDSSQPSTTRGALALSAGDREGALEVLRPLHRDDPGDTAVTRLLVFALLDVAAPTPEEIAEARAAAALLADPLPDGIRELLEGRARLAEGDVAGALGQLSMAAAARAHDPFAHFFHGQALYLSGDRRGSLGPLRRAVLLPTATASLRPVVAQAMVQVASESGDDGEREDLLTEALGLDPTNLRTVLDLFAIYYRRQDFTLAAIVTERLLEGGTLDDETARKIRHNALLARIAGLQFAEAVAHLEVLEADPRDAPRAAALRSVLLVRSQRVDEARALLSGDAVTTEEGRTLVVALLADRVREGDLDGARSYARAWSEARPDDPEMGLVLARMLVTVGRLDDAREVALETAESHPGHLGAVRMTVAVHVALGRAGDAEGLVRSAAERFEGADGRELELILAGLMASDPARAAAAIASARAIAGDPSASDEHRRMARAVEAEALVNLGRLDEARPVVAELSAGWEAGVPVTRVDQNLEASMRFLRGILHAVEGDLETAASEFSRRLELAPLDHATANNLAWTLAELGRDLERAMELAERAKHLSPGNADYWDTHGRCAEALGRHGVASASYRTALRCFDKEIPPRQRPRAGTAVRLAEILARHGDPSDVEKLARAALAWDPDGPASARARALLGLK